MWSEFAYFVFIAHVVFLVDLVMNLFNPLMTMSVSVFCSSALSTSHHFSLSNSVSNICRWLSYAWCYYLFFFWCLCYYVIYAQYCGAVTIDKTHKNSYNGQTLERLFIFIFWWILISLNLHRRCTWKSTFCVFKTEVSRSNYVSLQERHKCNSLWVTLEGKIWICYRKDVEDVERCA